jgi:short-subunit dehydrogenase
MTETHAMNFLARYGPWALIVGGSAGIGLGAADELASRGINVALVARRAQLLDERCAALRASHGVDARPIPMDLVEPDAAERLIAAVNDLEIGLMIYNAAAEPRGYFLELGRDEHLANIAVNVTAPTLLVHHLARPMIDRGHGGVVLVGSLGQFQGGKVFSAYFAAKAYEWILAEGLWAEFKEAGVDAFCYAVGATATENYRGQRQDPGLADVAGTERLRSPADPDAVGRRMLDLLGHGPTEFANPAEADEGIGGTSGSRRAAVERMSAITSTIRR